MSFGSVSQLGAPIWCALAAALGLTLAPGAEAEPDTVVAVDCPMLGTESRAALAARAKTELIVRGQVGTLVVLCHDDAAELTWHALVGGSARSAVQLSGDAEAVIERALEALDALLAAPSPTGEGAPQSAPTLASGTSASAVVEHGAEPPRSPEESHMISPAPHPVSSSQSVTVGVAAAGVAESWSPQVLGAVGPRSRLLIGVSPHVSFDAGAGIAWTIRSSERVAGRLVRVQLGGGYTIDHPGTFRIGLDAFVDLLRATPIEGLDTAAANDASFGAMLELDCRVLTSGAFALSIGPALFVRPGRVSVELGDHEVFGIPVVAVGAVLELAVQSGGSSTIRSHAEPGSGHQ